MYQKEISCIVQCGRKITQQELGLIGEIVKLFPGLSITELAETICENIGWFTASGNYKRDACVKLLHKLESRGVIHLRRGHEHKGRTRSAISVTARTAPGQPVRGKLVDVKPISLEVAAQKEAMGLCKEYLLRYHYLGYKQPFGCYLYYLIKCVKGPVGCALFSGAARSLWVRDQWIGWTAQQRLVNLGWVINNNRFLIFPWVEVRNLSSHVLGLIARRIGDDWKERWGYRPVLMETFVDLRYRGSCYKAAGWEYLGMTTGEGVVRKGKRYSTTPKRIFVKPLVENFRELLCSELPSGRREE